MQTEQIHKGMKRQIGSQTDRATNRGADKEVEYSPAKVRVDLGQARPAVAGPTREAHSRARPAQASKMSMLYRDPQQI